MIILYILFYIYPLKDMNKKTRRYGISLLYLSSALMFVGGLGDQFIWQYLDVHLDYLGNPPDNVLLNKSESLSMLMLHSAGGGLMSTGIAMFALTHFGVRSSQPWALWTILIIAFISQGINGYGMFSAGSYYWYPLIVLFVTFIGFIITYRTAHSK
jgi:hypothetical protein